MDDKNPIKRLGNKVRFKATGDIGVVTGYNEVNGVLTRVRVKWDNGCWAEYEPQYFELVEETTDA